MAGEDVGPRVRRVAELLKIDVGNASRLLSATTVASFRMPVAHYMIYREMNYVQKLAVKEGLLRLIEEIAGVKIPDQGGKVEVSVPITLNINAQASAQAQAQASNASINIDPAAIKELEIWLERIADPRTDYPLKAKQAASKLLPVVRSLRDLAGRG